MSFEREHDLIVFSTRSCAAPSADAEIIGVDLVRWPLWAWAIISSAFVGILVVTIDGMDTWWKVRRVKREFRQLQRDASASNP